MQPLKRWLEACEKYPNLPFRVGFWLVHLDGARASAVSFKLEEVHHMVGLVEIVRLHVHSHDQDLLLLSSVTRVSKFPDL